MKSSRCLLVVALVACGSASLAAEDDALVSDGRIVGGFRALEGSAPWQAELYSIHDKTSAEIASDKALDDSNPGKKFYADKDAWERLHRCGGAYIGDMWVITAAHCLASVENPLQDRRVRLGTQDLSVGGATYRIERVVIHARYRNTAGGDDIALLRIAPDSAANPASNVTAVAIRILGDSPGDRPLAERDSVSVTGWGVTSARRSGEQRAIDGSVPRASAALLQVDLLNLAKAKCEARYEKAYLGPGVICAGSNSPGKDSCTGDSGGPMTRRGQRPDERVLVGLVSWGKGCAEADTPGIYTNVTEYREWISAAKRESQPGAVVRR